MSNHTIHGVPAAPAASLWQGFLLFAALPCMPPTGPGTQKTHICGINNEIILKGEIKDTHFALGTKITDSKKINKQG